MSGRQVGVAERTILEALRKRANMVGFGATFTPEQRERIANCPRNGPFDDGTDANVTREITEVYRNSWINPILDEWLAGKPLAEIVRDHYLDRP